MSSKKEIVSEAEQVFIKDDEVNFICSNMGQ